MFNGSSRRRNRFRHSRSRRRRPFRGRLRNRRRHRNGWPRNHRPDRRPARDGRNWRIRHDVCLLPRKRNDTPRRGSLPLNLGCRRSARRSSRDHTRRRRRGRSDCRRRRYDCGTRRRRHGLHRGFSLLALQNSLQGVARLRYLRKVKLRLALSRLTPRTAAPAAILEILPNPLGLVGFDRTGVGLPRHANRFKRIQNRPALHFQFSCQIVDSNFAHPSLFASLRP